jgi:mutator protein MutT
MSDKLKPTHDHDDVYKRVGVGVVEQAGRYLITQRRFEDHLGGIWEFPGGKFNEGETDQECVRRELKEELGIDVEVGEHLDTIRYAYPDRKLELRFYHCSLPKSGGEPKAIDVQDYRWAKPEELIFYQFPKADREIVARLQKIQG